MVMADHPGEPVIKKVVHNVLVRSMTHEELVKQVVDLTSENTGLKMKLEAATSRLDMRSEDVDRLNAENTKIAKERGEALREAAVHQKVADHFARLIYAHDALKELEIFPDDHEGPAYMRLAGAKAALRIAVKGMDFGGNTSENVIVDPQTDLDKKITAGNVLESIETAENLMGPVGSVVMGSKMAESLGPEGIKKIEDQGIKVSISPGLKVEETAIKGKAETCLEEAARVVDGPRRESYGHPRDNHSRTAEFWSTYVCGRLREFFKRYYEPETVDALDSFSLDARDVCHMNSLQKISREVNAYKRDNVVDIAGYARNAEIVMEPDHGQG